MKHLASKLSAGVVCIILAWEGTAAQTEYLNRDYNGGLAVGYSYVWTDDIPAYTTQFGVSVRRLLDAGVLYSGSAGDVSSVGAFVIPWIRVKGYARHGVSVGLPLSIGRTGQNGFDYTYMTAGIGISRRIQAEYSDVFWLLSGSIGVHYAKSGIMMSWGGPSIGLEVDRWWESHLTGTVSLGVGIPIGRSVLVGISGTVGKVEGSPLIRGLDAVLVFGFRETVSQGS